MRLRRRVSHHLTVDAAIDVVVVCSGRLDRPSSRCHRDGGRVRQFPSEFGHVVNLVLAEVHCGRERNQVGQGAVSAALGDDLHRYQRPRLETVKVYLVDYRHVDRDAVTDQHGVVLLGDHAGDVPPAAHCV